MLCFIVMITHCSCGLIGPQKYECDADEVVSIQIVRFTELIKEENRFDYTVLAQISDYETFIDRLVNLRHSVNWGDPKVMYEGYTVIRIDFRNGDYDLIHHNAQVFHRSGNNNTGFFVFNEKQFTALISEYITNNELT